MNTQTESTNHTEKLISRLQRDIDQMEAILNFLYDHQATFESLNVPISTYCTSIDFDNLTRPDVLRVIKAFPGRWLKTNSFDGKLNYTLESDSDITLRLWGAEAPDCCVIEERVEYVNIPAHTERRVTRTLKCPEPSADVPSANAE